MARAETGAKLASLSRFGFPTRQVESVVSVGTTPTLLARNNPDRVFLALILEGSFAVRVGRNGEVTTASGAPMASTNDGLTYEPDVDGEGTGYERWAIANGGASNVRVIETIMTPDKE